MLTGIHFLLTYACNFECDHCFLHCSPKSEGTFTLKQIRNVLDEATKIGTIETIYFEGGEPFLYYPLMLEGMKIARDLGFNVGVVTNSYWATTIEDASLWIKPIRDLQISNFSVSDDPFHFKEDKENLAKIAFTAGDKMNMPMSSITIEEPTVKIEMDKEQEKGKPVIGGGAMFRGRAVEKLTEGLPQRWWEELSQCPYEDLRDPGRVHIDSYGNIHLCQGLSLGNMWEIPLSELIKTYNADSHPICGPLIRGGPAQLIREYDIKHIDKYVDECHLCYLARLALINKFPEYLTPRQVYGLE